MENNLQVDNIFEYPIFVKADVIFSSLTFEAAAPTENDYRKNIKKVVQYLKPKGYLFIVGCLEETFYVSGDQKLPVLCTTKEFVINTLKENGLSIVSYESVEEPVVDPIKTGYDAKGFFALLAQNTQ